MNHETQRRILGILLRYSKRKFLTNFLLDKISLVLLVFKSHLCQLFKKITSFISFVLNERILKILSKNNSENVKGKKKNIPCV